MGGEGGATSDPSSFSNTSSNNNNSPSDHGSVKPANKASVENMDSEGGAHAKEQSHGGAVIPAAKVVTLEQTPAPNQGAEIPGPPSGVSDGEGAGAPVTKQAASSAGGAPAPAGAAGADSSATRIKQAFPPTGGAGGVDESAHPDGFHTPTSSVSQSGAATSVAPDLFHYIFGAAEYLANCMANGLANAQQSALSGSTTPRACSKTGAERCASSSWPRGTSAVNAGKTAALTTPPSLVEGRAVEAVVEALAATRVAVREGWQRSVATETHHAKGGATSVAKRVTTPMSAQPR